MFWRKKELRASANSRTVRPADPLNAFKKDANKQPNAYMRSWGFVYPTIDGVIDTISWEGQREAADDVRFITLFRQLAAENGKRYTIF